MGWILANGERHYGDACKEADYPSPDIDTEYFLSESLAGRAYAVTLHLGDETLGYAVYTLTNGTFTKQILEAYSHAIYVEKPHRGRGSLFLVNQAEKLLGALGAQEVHYVIKSGPLGRLLERAGHAQQFQHWSKTLCRRV